MILLIAPMGTNELRADPPPANPDVAADLLKQAAELLRAAASDPGAGSDDSTRRELKLLALEIDDVRGRVRARAD